MAQTGVSGPVVVDGESFLDALFAATRRNPTKLATKGPKFPGATRRETLHQISPHILNTCLQPFFSTSEPAWSCAKPLLLYIFYRNSFTRLPRVERSHSWACRTRSAASVGACERKTLESAPISRHAFFASTLRHQLGLSPLGSGSSAHPAAAPLEHRRIRSTRTIRRSSCARRAPSFARRYARAPPPATPARRDALP